MVNQNSQERHSGEEVCTRDAQESQVGTEDAGKVAIKARPYRGQCGRAHCIFVHQIQHVRLETAHKNGKVTTDKKTPISLCGAWQCRGPRLPLPGQSGGNQGGDLRKSAMVHRAQLEALLSIVDSHFLMEGSCQHSTSLSWWVQKLFIG